MLQYVPYEAKPTLIQFYDNDRQLNSKYLWIQLPWLYEQGVKFALDLPLVTCSFWLDKIEVVIETEFS